MRGDHKHGNQRNLRLLSQISEGCEENSKQEKHNNQLKGIALSSSLDDGDDDVEIVAANGETRARRRRRSERRKEKEMLDQQIQRLVNKRDEMLEQQIQRLVNSNTTITTTSSSGRSRSSSKEIMEQQIQRLLKMQETLLEKLEVQQEIISKQNDQLNLSTSTPQQNSSSSSSSNNHQQKVEEKDVREGKRGDRTMMTTLIQESKEQPMREVTMSILFLGISLELLFSSSSSSKKRRLFGSRISSREGRGERSAAATPPYQHNNLKEDICLSVSKLTGIAVSHIRMSDILPAEEERGGGCGGIRGKVNILFPSNRHAEAFRNQRPLRVYLDRCRFHGIIESIHLRSTVRRFYRPTSSTSWQEQQGGQQTQQPDQIINVTDTTTTASAKAAEYSVGRDGGDDDRKQNNRAMGSSIGKRSSRQQQQLQQDKKTDNLQQNGGLSRNNRSSGRETKVGANSSSISPANISPIVHSSDNSHKIYSSQHQDRKHIFAATAAAAAATTITGDKSSVARRGNQNPSILSSLRSQNARKYSNEVSAITRRVRHPFDYKKLARVSGSLRDPQCSVFPWKFQESRKNFMNRKEIRNEYMAYMKELKGIEGFMGSWNTH